jgi:hypothetical protein
MHDEPEKKREEKPEEPEKKPIPIVPAPPPPRPRMDSDHGPLEIITSPPGVVPCAFGGYAVLLT